jgi:hypothetical protein
VAEWLRLVEPHTAADPIGTGKGLNWRLRDLQHPLAAVGPGVSLPVISRLLKAHGYRLRQKVKQRAEGGHPERGRQFEDSGQQRSEHQQPGHPSLSVDTQKQERVGNFKHAGPIGCQAAEAVKGPDFLSEGERRAVP